MDLIDQASNALLFDANTGDSSDSVLPALVQLFDFVGHKLNHIISAEHAVYKYLDILMF